MGCGPKGVGLLIQGAPLSWLCKAPKDGRVGGEVVTLLGLSRKGGRFECSSTDSHGRHTFTDLPYEVTSMESGAGHGFL